MRRNNCQIIHPEMRAAKNKLVKPTAFRCGVRCELVFSACIELVAVACAGCWTFSTCSFGACIGDGLGVGDGFGLVLAVGGGGV